MEVKSGYLYHIKDKFFDIMDDKNLMINHEKGKNFVFKEEEILWFIPLSSNIEKYQKIIDKKVQKYGRCDTILIRKILSKNNAILFQNAFPTLEKYIDHVHLLPNGQPAKVIETLKNEIFKKFLYLLKLKSNGINLFFTDIDKIKEKSLEETIIPNK